MNDSSQPPPHSWSQRLARACRVHYGRVFLATAVVLVISGWLISRLRLDTDVSNLLPRKDSTLNAYLETLAEFGTFDYLLIAVSIPQGQAADPYEAFTDALAERLKQLPELESVEHRVDDPEKLLAQFLPRSMLFLHDEDRPLALDRLSPEGLTERAQDLRRLLSTPQSLVLRDLVRLDPAGLAEIFIDRIESGQGTMAIDWMSGYYLSQDQRLLLVLAKPKDSPHNIEFDQRLSAAVEKSIVATQAEWAEFYGPRDQLPAPPEVKVGGPHISAMVDERLIRGDMQLNSSTSMVLVLLLFWYAFRRIGTVVYAFVPLTMGMILTFAFASAVFGVVSSATSGTAALLIGLGIDFVIVAYGRFVDERCRGLDFAEALDVVMGRCARGVVVGAVTTSASFFAFTFTDFRGLSQMGILTGVGILFCLVSVMVLLPAMLGWSESHHVKRSKVQTFYLHSFGVDHLIRFCFRHPKGVLTAGAVVTALAAWQASELKFNDNWRNLRPQGNPGVEVEQLVQTHFKSDFDYMMLILRGDNLETLLDRTEEATEKARGLVAQGVLTGVSSATTLIPTPKKQQQAITWLAERRADGGLDPERIERDFRAALAAEGMRYEPFADGIGMLRQALVASEPISFEGVAGSGQAAQMVGRMIQQKGGGWQSVIKLYQPAERWRREAPPEAHALAASLGPDAILTGANVVNKVVRERVRRDAWIGVALGTFLVFLIVLADFRDLSVALFCQVPLFLGVLWMLGAMAALGLQMNFMNVFVTTMILGVGVDYGLHMMHRYRETQLSGEDPMAALAETGNAVLLAALTSIAGFGSLAISHFPGIQSTGYVATLGSISTVIVALTLLPAFLALRTRKAPGL